MTIRSTLCVWVRFDAAQLNAHMRRKCSQHRYQYARVPRAILRLDREGWRDWTRFVDLDEIAWEMRHRHFIRFDHASVLEPQQQHHILSIAASFLVCVRLHVRHMCCVAGVQRVNNPRISHDGIGQL